jgi:hypothetical protein
MKSDGPRFSGYFFRMPDELDPLMDLTPAQIKVCLVCLSEISN